MRRSVDLTRRFLRHCGGATAIEYGLLVAVLSVVVVGALIATGDKLYAKFDLISTKVDGR